MKDKSIFEKARSLVLSKIWKDAWVYQEYKKIEANPIDFEQKFIDLAKVVLSPLYKALE